MSLIYRIVYAAHANGTHHKLALDALMQLQHPQAEVWRNLMLKHVGLYLEGSKDPDNKFKDFKNHVLHVKDGYWGGAPEKVQNWYQHLVAALQAENWSEAAYAAGVLSHYYTDPIHPFHTGQTAAENNIHRAAEWSINRSYGTLKAISERAFSSLEVSVPDGPDWLRVMTCNGADFSHRYYEKLIAHYDIHRGVVDPPAGLDEISRKFVAELLAYASSGFARILDRAFTESGKEPPVVSLTLDTILAALQIPAKMLQKRLTNAADRDVVQRMYDELKATGTVETNLPEDDRVVRDLHAKEVLEPLAAAQAALRAARLEPQPEPQVRQRHSGGVAPPAPALGSEIPAAPTAVVSQLAVDSAVPDTEAKGRAPRVYLAVADDLEAAPSIGRKTADRFAGIGIRTVGDFLDGDPADLASRLGQPSISVQHLVDWQAQSRLMMAVPGLRGTHAQLFVGAGYRDADALIAGDADTLCADVMTYAATAAGQRVLRDGSAPDIGRLRGFIANAVAYAEAA